ncbi:DMT family transporter [Altericroceibacterium endophyticum]|uniref:EamA family transporter n=1 Tax=Altericroceibacterium endophyticum TaxID=1808508 RepID=A0A6I4T7C0_9SPHN|nr:DMT family transporter [Altericroceibacterium endophyticum]MXO65735.1 EamA family transporter [Altericroceibacterium endophyticum]
MIGPKPPHALMRPGIVLPFLLVALIWGSTWLVIKGQIGLAPESWSVTYRFAIATVGMFLLAAFQRRGFRMTLGGHLMAIAIGLSQFFLNFNFVYRAEIHLTSGLVAVIFALLMLPNAIFARIFLGQEITTRFLAGTGLALVGIACLLVHEYRAAPPDGMVALGVFFALCGILSASTANVLQASETARLRPMVLMLAWAMLWGTLADAAFAWTVAGAPVFPTSREYWLGVAYLGIFGSVVTFPLYFGLVRQLGPGRAAYNGVLVPVVAMLLSTLFEDFRWSSLAIAGAAVALLGMLVALRARSLPAARSIQDSAIPRNPLR